MTKRMLWLPIVSILSLSGMSQILPALAGEGFNRFGMAGPGPRLSIRVPEAPTPKRAFLPHRSDVRSSLRFQHRAQFQLGWPGVIWPYTSDIGTPPPEVGLNANETPPEPQIIVMSDVSHAPPGPAASQTLPDLGHIAGCRAIPTGYHCDNHHSGTEP
jgi:hypothetical protein